MNKIKLLSILIGLLVLLNVIVLCFFLIGKQHIGPINGHHIPDRHGNNIKESFGFNDNQADLFEISKNKHVEESKSLSKDLKDASLDYYQHSESIETKDSLYANIQSITQKIYEANDNHFNEVRKICTADQLPQMDEFIKGLLNRRGPRPLGGKKMRGRRKNRE